MSKIGNAIISVEELYSHAYEQYQFWAGLCLADINSGNLTYENYYNAGKFYGEMRACALIQNDLLGDRSLYDNLCNVEPELFD